MDEPKTCRHCGHAFLRSRYAESRRLESMTAYRKRMYCSQTCQRRAAARSGGKARWDLDLIEDRHWPWGTQIRGRKLTELLLGLIERQVALVIDRGAIDRIRDGESPEAVCDDIVSSISEKLFEGTVRRVAQEARQRETG